MRTLKELLNEAEMHVKYATELHHVCSRKLDTIRPAIIKELLPIDRSLYARFGDSIAVVEPIEVQIKQLVVFLNGGKTARYKLTEETRPRGVILLVVKKEHEFFVRYLSKDDITAFPPFHILNSGKGDDWYSVCLGREYDPTRQMLANVLEVVNLTDSYMNLLSLPATLGLDKVPKPFDAWITAEPHLRLGKSTEGFELVEEITL